MTTLFEVPRGMNSDTVLQQLKLAYHKTIKTTNNALAEQTDYYTRCRIELDRSEQRDKERLERLKAQALAALEELSNGGLTEHTYFPVTNTTVVLREPIDPTMPNQDAAALVVRYFGEAGATTGEVFPEIARAGHHIMKSDKPRQTLSNALKAAVNKGVLIKVVDRFFYQDEGGALPMT
jgi:hypothetical protein